MARTLLLQASRRPVGEQAVLLEQALDVARRAHDVDHQVKALERLLTAHWQSGAHRAAVISFGALSNLIGQEDATARCPEPMVAELDQWDTAITEGRAHWPVPEQT